MEDAIEKPHGLLTPFTLLALVAFISVIAANFYFFYFKKNYEFIVETACDPTQEECFQRDCSEEGACPPNELSIFKRYSLTALDFNSCENEDCARACETGQIICTLLECEEDIEFGESCSVPLSLEAPIPEISE